MTLASLGIGLFDVIVNERLVFNRRKIRHIRAQLNYLVCVLTLHTVGLLFAIS